jgi:hypothetical protein
MKQTPGPRGQHALPARPGSRNGPGNGLNNSTNSNNNGNTSVSVGNTSIGSNGTGTGTPSRAPSRGPGPGPAGPLTPGPGSLAARMGMSVTQGGGSRDASPAARPASPPLPPPGASTGDSERKRPNDGMPTFIQNVEYY